MDSCKVLDACWDKFTPFSENEDFFIEESTAKVVQFLPRNWLFLMNLFLKKKTMTNLQTNLQIDI